MHWLSLWILIKKITGPFNLGNPVEYSIIEIANLILKMTNSKSKLSFEKLPQDDPQKRRPNISLARKHLLWEPKIKLEDGLKSTIKYFKRTIL